MSFGTPFNPSRTAPAASRMLNQMMGQQNGASPAVQDWQSPVFNRDAFTSSVQPPQQPFALQNVVGIGGQMPWGARK